MSTVGTTRKPAEDRRLLEAAARAWSGPEPKLHSKSLADCLGRAIEEHRTLIRRLEVLLDRARSEEQFYRQR